MKILMVTSEFPPNCGGIGWYVYYLAKEMRSRGHQVTILQRGKHTKRKFKDFYIYYINAGIFPWLNACKMVNGVRYFLKEFPHDVAIIHGTVLGAWIKSVPTILVSHLLFAEAKKNIYKGARDLNSLLHIIFSKLYLKAEKLSLKGVDAIAVVSYAMQKEVMNHYGLKSTYVGNAVDVELFKEIDSYNKRQVFFPSFLRPQKGIIEAIQIMRIVRLKGCDIKFLFINAGSMRKTLIKAIERYSLYPVELISPVEHKRLREIYHNSSIVFLPSRCEGLPNVILEAMACGLPVVASDVGGTKELVIHQKTGYIHSITDIEGMANSILKLDKDILLRKEMGKRARQLILENYTWNQVSNRFEKLIEEIR